MADLAALTRRLAETPQEFLAEPRVAGHGEVAVAALVTDVLRLYGARAGAAVLAEFEGVDARADRNRLALAMIMVWLLADDALRAARPAQEDLVAALSTLARELAAVTRAHAFVHDAERREELVRSVLARLRLRPHGETEAQSADRLSAISALQRRALLDASRKAEARAHKVRQALARKLAEESADKWTRE